MLKQAALIAFTVFTCLVLAGCSAFQASPSENEAQRLEFMMDTVVDITAYGQNAQAALDLAFARLTEIENHLSKTIASSDLATLNAAAGQNPVEVSPETWYLLKKAVSYAKLTAGAYEPVCLALISLWGIGTEQETVPTSTEISYALERVGYNLLSLDETNMTAFLNKEGAGVDLGGIAKGYAADEIEDLLREQKIDQGMLYFGGSITVWGGKPDGQPWVLGIQNPINPDKGHFATISLYNGSLVTSGDYQRYFEKDGIRYHHIMDPQTGYPVNNELAGVTILTSQAVHGDALSTALFVMGLEKGLAFAEDQPELEAIFVTKEQKVYLTTGLKDKIKLVDGGFTIEEGR